jgi:hypothetical protein
MDTQTLLADMKARFAHNSAKHYLKEKFSSKLLVADQNGLWKADISTLTFLSNIEAETIVLLDLYETPVEVNVKSLYDKLYTTYTKIMTQWHTEYKELENKR